MSRLHARRDQGHHRREPRRAKAVRRSARDRAKAIGRTRPADGANPALSQCAGGDVEAMGREGIRRRRFLRSDRKRRSQRHEAGAEQFEKEGEMNMNIDPVCGMAVDPATAAGKFDYEGETYYFCHPNCLRKFSAAPQDYLNKAPQLAAMGRPVVQLGGKSGSQRVMTTAQPRTETRIVREGDEYTCPMDPEAVPT